MSMMRRLPVWAFRYALKPFGSLAVRLGGRRMAAAAWRMSRQSLLDSALESTPLTSTQTHTRVFQVTPPLTVYVKASHCRVLVQRDEAPTVTLQASMMRGFGLEFATEQDEVGVYIVVRRKPVLGQLTRVDISLTVPYDSHLALNLSAGEVVMQSVDHLLELPPLTPENASTSQA